MRSMFLIGLVLIGNRYIMSIATVFMTQMIVTIFPTNKSERWGPNLVSRFGDSGAVHKSGNTWGVSTAQVRLGA